MKDAILDFLSSKKALAYLSAIVVVLGNKIVGHFGYELDGVQVALIVGACSAYIIGQGYADHGKEAAKITSDAYADATIAVFKKQLPPEIQKPVSGELPVKP